MDPSAHHGPPPPDLDKANPGLLVLNWILLPISLASVLLRLHTRLFVKRSAGWDDWFMVVAIVLAIVYAIIQTIQIHWGYGHHAVYLSPSSLNNLGWSNVFITDVNAVCLFFVRTSICIFLLRMTATVSIWSYPIYFAILVNAVVMVGTVVLYAAMCIPLVGLWDKTIHADCSVLFHATPVIKALGALNAFEDVLCAVIPVIVIKDLQISNKSKLSLSAILISCGAVTAACAIGRIAALPTGVAPDPTYDWVSVTYWQAAEQYGAITFASLPAINQLQIHFRANRTLWPSKKSSDMYAQYGQKDPEQGGGRSAEVSKASRARSGREKSRDSRLGITKTTDVYIELSDVGSEEHPEGARYDPRTVVEGSHARASSRASVNRQSERLNPAWTPRAPQK